jgi:hypothetical protein
MMGFSAEWLALREPVDHRSVNPEVRAAIARQFIGRDSVTVVDLGSGAASNLRGTFSVLPKRQDWTLVDYDPALLMAARQRLTAWADAADEQDDALVITKDEHTLTVHFLQADLSESYDPVLSSKPDLVTAAALFDLVSVQSIEKLAETVSRQQTAFYTVLTYDGFASWEPTHPSDGPIRDAFNTHQRSDKGFGPAAGPGGTSALSRAFYTRGHRVLRGTSPWRVDAANATMRKALDEGFANAARETGRVPATDIESWIAHRGLDDGSVSIIGHEDLLALPG